MSENPTPPVTPQTPMVDPIPSNNTIATPTGQTSSSNGSGMGSNSPVPPEIDGWGWGPFFLTWIWGIFHGVWISLLIFIPVPLVSLIMMIVLGINGRKWAWQSKKWESVEHFNKVQKKWSTAGVIITILSFALIPLIAILSMIVIVAINPLERIRDAEYKEIDSEVTTVGKAISDCITDQMAKGTSTTVIYTSTAVNSQNGQGGCASLENLKNGGYLESIYTGTVILTGNQKICAYIPTVTESLGSSSFDSSTGTIVPAPNGVADCI